MGCLSIPQLHPQSGICHRAQGADEAGGIVTGRGRPAIGERVEVRIPPDLLARLDAEAARQGITRAELVRDIVKEKVG
jgi:hypothetical protein